MAPGEDKRAAASLKHTLDVEAMAEEFSTKLQGHMDATEERRNEELRRNGLLRWDLGFSCGNL